MYHHHLSKEERKPPDKETVGSFLRVVPRLQICYCDEPFDSWNHHSSSRILIYFEKWRNRREKAARAQWAKKWIMCTSVWKKKHSQDFGKNQTFFFFESLFSNGLDILCIIIKNFKSFLLALMVQKTLLLMTDWRCLVN